MRYTADTPGESDLEREYELSFDNATRADEGCDVRGDQSAELADEELDADDELGADEEFDASGDDVAGEFEALHRMDDGGDDELPAESEHGARLYELSLREFESDSHLTAAVLGELDRMGEEYFFGSLARRLRKSGRGLLRKATRMAGNLPAMQAVKGFTQLARDGLKGQLGSLITSAMASAIPGGAMALPALRSLGIDLPGGAAERETFDQLAEISREAFEHLAQTVDEEANNPLQAGRLAAAALQAGLQRAGRRRTIRVDAAGGRRGSGAAVRRITLRRGERLIISVE